MRDPTLESTAAVIRQNWSPKVLINRNLNGRRNVTPKWVLPHPEYRLEAILKVYSTASFARMHGVSDSRIRQLIAEDRVFPRQKLANGRHIMFANSVIVAPYERRNRKLRGAD